VTSSLIVEEVEGALNGVLERLKGEGLIAAVLRSGNAPVFPRAYVMLRTVEISTRSIGGTSTRSSQEYELVFEGLGADPIEQYGKVLRAALRTRRWDCPVPTYSPLPSSCVVPITWTRVGGQSSSR